MPGRFKNTGHPFKCFAAVTAGIKRTHVFIDGVTKADRLICPETYASTCTFLPNSNKAELYRFKPVEFAFKASAEVSESAAIQEYSLYRVAAFCAQNTKSALHSRSHSTFNSENLAQFNAAASTKLRRYCNSGMAGQFCHNNPNRPGGKNPDIRQV